MKESLTKKAIGSKIRFATDLKNFDGKAIGPQLHSTNSTITFAFGNWKYEHQVWYLLTNIKTWRRFKWRYIPPKVIIPKLLKHTDWTQLPWLPYYNFGSIFYFRKHTFFMQVFRKNIIYKFSCFINITFSMLKWSLKVFKFGSSNQSFQFISTSLILPMIKTTTLSLLTSAMRVLILGFRNASEKWSCSQEGSNHNNSNLKYRQNISHYPPNQVC